MARWPDEFASDNKGKWKFNVCMYVYINSTLGKCSFQTVLFHDSQTVLHGKYVDKCLK